MGGAPAFSGNASGRSKGNMYGEAGRGKGHHAARGRGGQGDGDWKNQKSRLQMAQEEDALEAGLGFVNFTEGDERLGWLVNVSSVSGPNNRHGRSRGIGAALKDENASIHTRYARRYPPARSPSRAPIQNLSKAWHPALPVFQNSAKLNFQTLPIPAIQTTVQEAETGKEFSAVNCYFMQQDGDTFKAQVRYAPYFLIATKPDCEHDVEAFLRRRYEGKIHDVTVLDKEDLDLKNHLSGLKQKYLKVTFATVQDLMDVRREVLPMVKKNQSRSEAAEAYEALHQMEASAVTHQGRAHHGVSRGGEQKSTKGKRAIANYADAMIDIREYDVPYHMRFLIDTETRCGWWYKVKVKQGEVTLTHRKDMLARGEVKICAFDIETTKLPLKFPDAEYDQVFMISYMLDGQGYLIINREVVSADIEDFEYSPKPEYPGPFIVWNEPDEAALLRRWFDHMREVRPSVYVTYNGDFFDWPFVETRAEKNGMSMYLELGFRCDRKTGECRSRSALHLDAFAWVKRDSYLPAGSHGLKAVTKAKLGYNPVEVDPEDMLPFAQEQPHHMAAYSVSDAVSTYYLYMTYVHPFIFSLATIIPLSPDEVLRKGSGTLCEALLMVEAYRANIVCPNKTQSAGEKHYKGHLLESETYIGGHVECLEAGVFRADIPTKFRMNPKGYQGLLDSLDEDLKYALYHEGKKMTPEDVENYDEVRAAIAEKLVDLRDNPVQMAKPLIYHLDVAAMYPNIILTNRLQPPAMVTEDVCAACDFNRPGKTCLREMEWLWRGEHYAATSSDYAAIKAQLEAEKFPPKADGTGDGRPRYWADLSYEEQAAAKKKRLKMYSQKVYKRVLDKPVTESKMAGICQRENGFYVDTVKNFRDRRYEYKGLNKTWKGKLGDAKKSGNPIAVQEAKDMVTLFDSLQLAHKCILNSFYGYVMRKGARWYSMEMAGVVTYTGAKIIQMAKRLVDDIGKPLELDTDGIWCCLPGTFPEEFTLKPKEGVNKKKLTISYPCSVLNRLTALQCTNDQYQTLTDKEKRTYESSSEMSIEFEVDGPYKAMILPASKEEGVLIKKRYAVFNFDGSLEELKGFEVKRRGELKLIKMFQTEVFDEFLKGTTLEEVYEAVGKVANKWLDMLDSKGRDLTDEDLVDYISEATTMSKSLEEYGDRKSCATTTAKRLGAIIGGDIANDKGLKAQYIITKKPAGAPTSQRAVPVTVFQHEPAVARSFLRDWTKDSPPGDADEVPDMRELLDWDYYKTRLASAIQKIISIPAALQHVPNPCPRVTHPDWLHKMVREKDDKFKQRKLADLFGAHDAKRELLAAKDPNAPEHDAAATPGKKARGDELDMEDVAGAAPGTLIGKTNGPRVQRFFRGVEDAARGGGVPTTPETAAVAARTLPGSGPSPADGGNVTGNVRRRNALDPVDIAREAFESLGSCPDKREDFDGWLRHHKAKWRLQRTERKRRRVQEADALAAAGGVTPGFGRSMTRPRTLGPGGLGAFVESRERTLATSAWQLVQIEPAAAGPGHFTAWVLAAGTIHSVPIKVSRRLAVAMRSPDREGDLGLGGKKRVSAILPRGAKAEHVYEVKMEESEFASGLEVMDLLANPNVVGVFERHVPLLEAAVQKIGCVASLRRGESRVDGGTVSEYDLDQLEMRTTAECGYVPLARPDASQAVRGMMRHVSLYRAGDKGKGVYALHTPATGAGVLVVVEPGAVGNGRRNQGVREVTVPAMDRAWRAARARVEADGNDAATRAEGANDGIDWIVEYVKDDASAGAAVSRHLQAYLEDPKGPAVCVVEAPVDSGVDAVDGSIRREGVAGRLGAIIPALARLPVVHVPANAADTASMPAIGWQVNAAKTACARLAAHGDWLAERVAISRYAHIPVGNLGQDWCLHTADTFFARALRDSSQLLWTGPGGVPDLGGGSGDGALSGLDDTLQTTRAEVNNPGAYRCVCVELRAHHLAVCAIANAHLLNDLEQGALLGYEQNTVGSGKDKGDSGVRGGHEAAAAFRTLRTLVNNWLVDATERRNPYADALLGQLRRWLLSAFSTLREPALRHLVELCMKKVFTLLLAEVKKLGATVVHADMQTITIATGKNRLASAAAFVDGLRASLRRRELFSWLELEPSRQWHSLLFRGPYDYGGLLASALPGAKQWSGHDTLGPDDFELDPVATRAAGVAEAAEALDMHWNIASFLPESIREHFEVIVSEFIFRPWKRDFGGGLDDERDEVEDVDGLDDGEGDDAKARVPPPLDTEGLEHEGDEALDECLLDATPPQAREAGQTGPGQEENEPLPARTPLAGREAAEAAEEERAAWLAGQVGGYFSQRILRLVGEINRVLGPGTARHLGPQHRFPTPPGAHLPKELRGSPALAFVKTLCAALSLDTSVEGPVSLLRKNALKLLRVPEYAPQAEFREPCVTFVMRDAVCNYCSACADLDLCRDERLVEDANWDCAACGNPYDPQWIEGTLVAHVNERVRQAQLQDLRCTRDRRIKVSHLAARCACGGLYGCVEDAAATADDLRVMHDIARHHDFKVLRDVVEWVVRASPNLSHARAVLDVEDGK